MTVGAASSSVAAARRVVGMIAAQNAVAGQHDGHDEHDDHADESLARRDRLLLGRGSWS